MKPPARWAHGPAVGYASHLRSVPVRDIGRRRRSHFALLARGAILIRHAAASQDEDGIGNGDEAGDEVPGRSWPRNYPRCNSLILLASFVVLMGASYWSSYWSV